MPPKTIGEQELLLLKHVADAGSSTVAEVAEAFGAARSLARSTVLTMMERLRAKGFLKRRREGGVYRYAAARTPADVLQGEVSAFVEGTLDGSVSPFVTWLSERTDVTEAELADLQDLVARLQSRRKEEP